MLQVMGPNCFGVGVSNFGATFAPSGSPSGRGAALLPLCPICPRGLVDPKDQGPNDEIRVRASKLGFARQKQGSRFFLKKLQRGPGRVRDPHGVVAFCKFGAKSRLGFERRNQGSRISPKNKERGPREGGKGDR